MRTLVPWILLNFYLLATVFTEERNDSSGSRLHSLVSIACHRDASLSFCKSSPLANGVSTRFLRAPAVNTALADNDRLLLEELAAAVKRTGGNPFDKKRTARQGRGNGSDLREKDSENEEGFIPEEEERHTNRKTVSNKEAVEAEEVEELLAETTTQSSEVFKAVEEQPTPREKAAITETEVFGDVTKDPFLEAETIGSPTSTALSIIEATTEDTEEVRGFKGEKDEYCDNYEQHFSYYCVGEKNDQATGKFCTSYKKACPNKKATTGHSVTDWPEDPFGDKKGTTKVETREETLDLTEEESQVTEQELYYAELKKRFPCKPDCDHRLFPHCTADCKCDYIYPQVQRFCNPPPMPLFLNTCRLWYNSCPKYDAYHYASQFIYSKAEKDKVLPGVASGIKGGAVSPVGLRPFAQGVKTKENQEKEILYVPPPLPPGYKEKLKRRGDRSERVVVDVFEQVSRKNKERRRRRRINASRRTQKTTTIAPPTARELYKKLKVLSALTADPVKLTQDLVGQGGPDFGAASPKGSETGPNGRPKALAPSVIPVVPSEAAYGAGAVGTDPFQRFAGLTDSRGILHRPRSSSPFTKPGLWAANPDDPHNRDHANRYYYHPESVGVDWLNGQIQWGAHWAVPAALVGGTNGFSTVHFPTIGHFLNIPDDYD